MDNNRAGTISWADLTVDKAEEIKDFYCQVGGWQASEVDMGGYSDFNMNLPMTGKPAAGICHARGTNQGLPPQWLIYITVVDLQESLQKCIDLGGKVLAGPVQMGEQGGYCVIADPSGAAVALYSLPGD